MQVHIVQEQCGKARQAAQEVEEAQAASNDLQSQLDRLKEALHSQQHFVTSLEAATTGTNAGAACLRPLVLLLPAMPHEMLQGMHSYVYAYISCGVLHVCQLQCMSSFALRQQLCATSAWQ